MPTTTYAKLRDGSWGIRSDAPLTAGATVTVTRRDGSTRSETVDRVLFTGQDGVTLASITPTSKPTTRAGGAGSAETKRCWECGLPFTRAEARARGGEWADGYCGC